MVAYNKSTLDNGIRIVTESQKESRTVSIGIWVLTGSRDETLEDAGISHFLEHLVFKGTKKRTAFQIAKSLEELGGDLNAFTTREYTCYHATVLKDHWQIAMDVLCDLVAGMKLKRTDFELERSVILQEIAMGEDQHDEVIYDIYMEKSLGRNPVGRPIAGSVASIARMKQKQILEYYKSRYTGSNLIISAAGNIDHKQLTKMAEKLLGRKTRSKDIVPRKKPTHRPARVVVDKPTEQLHVLFGMPCSSFTDKDRFEAFIVNALLGGGMTSRLYQSVREKRGLVYTVYSSLNTFDDFGFMNIYAASEPKNMKRVVLNILTELRALKQRGISASQLKLFKTQVTGSLLLGADDVDNRMQSIAVNEMVFGQYKPIELIIEEINKVTVGSVNKYIRERLDIGNMAAVLLGANAESFREWFMDLEFK